MLARVFGTFWGNSYIFFVRQFCFPTEQVKKLLQWLNKHWNTTCSQYVHAGCVKHVRNTTELSKASSHMIKSNKSGEIGRLARLVTIQKLLHDPKPLGAQTRGKYSKEKQKRQNFGPHVTIFPRWLCFVCGFCGGLLVAHRFRIRKDSCNIPVLFNEAESLHVIYEIKWHSGAGSTNYHLFCRRT